MTSPRHNVGYDVKSGLDKSVLDLYVVYAIFDGPPTRETRSTSADGGVASGKGSSAMELSEARTIVKTLAEGVDPVTGEVFAPDSPYNHPQVIRALFTVHSYALGPRSKMSPEERRRQNLELGRPTNAGLPWSDGDRSRVAAGFRGGETIEALATALERSRAAIQAEMIRQGLVPPVAG